VGKLETLRAADAIAQKNNGAPGVDGVTFEAIEEAGAFPQAPTVDVYGREVPLRAAWCREEGLNH
jgi:RNA-directed DNA polymerase